MVQGGAQNEEELDLLDALAQLDIHPPYQKAVSTPPRTRSRLSQTSPRISPRGSDHSLRSDGSSTKGSFRSSLKATYQRSSSSLSRALQREVAADAADQPDDERTPSLRQAGFISPSRQTFSGRDLSPRTSGESTSSDRRMTRARSGTAIPSPGSSAGPPPLRLLARAPCNEARPGDELALFRELEATSRTAHTQHRDSQEGRAADEASLWSGRSSVLSERSLPRSSSLRVNRLRQDIALEADRIRERTSLEELRRNAEAASALEQGFDTEAGGIPPGLPSAAADTAARMEQSPSRSSAPVETASLESYGSLGATSFISLADSQRSLRARAAGSVSTYSVNSGRLPSGRGDYTAGSDGKTRRSRPREAREWTQVCWLWCSEQPIASKLGSGHRFVKAPVPIALKRKSNKRESAPHLSPAETMLFGASTGSAAPTAKSKDRDNKLSVEEQTTPSAPSALSGTGPASPALAGRWKRVSAVLRDDGCLRIYSDNDNNILHTAQLANHDRHDIRLVDHSLFGRPNCLCIDRSNVASATPTPYRSSFPASTSLPLSDSIYLCMPSIVTTHVWFVMARCFASPEDTSASNPRSVQKLRLPARAPDDLLVSDDDDAEAEGASKTGASANELEDSFRIVRGLQITINEVRGLGDSSAESMRTAAKSSWDRPGLVDTESTASRHSPARSTSSFAIGRYPSRPSTEDRDDSSGPHTYCEIDLGGTIIAQTSTRTGSNPFWNETFAWKDLAPMLEPARIRVLQAAKSSTRARLVGIVELRLPDLARHRLNEDWLPVNLLTLSALPTTAAGSTAGEMSIATRISEEIVLPLSCYSSILQMLCEDENADLVTEIAAAAPHELEETTRMLLRIFSSQSLLLDRIDRLAQLEVENSLRQNRSAAILFRGNTILTKSIELYLRLVGAEYLDASIGDTVRRICADKVEIEIDPLKYRHAVKEKELARNTQALQEWTRKLWDSIYRARDKCPRDLRLMFNRIQSVVVSRYEAIDDQKNTRYTCISAFIFLRFFVPAVLNPRLFFLVSSPPDHKSQRTLTLIAKSLQGLANFSSFGQKEPWMQPMNSFVKDCSEGLVDFLQHVSTPVDSNAHRQEWTSPSAAAYVAPNRLRDGLPPILREGIPSLPHLVDLPKELGALASRLSRMTSGEDGDLQRSTGPISAETGRRSATPSIISSRSAYSQAFQDLINASIAVEQEARRRAGALAVHLPPLNTAASASRGDLRQRGMSGRSARADGVGHSYGSHRSPRSPLHLQPKGSADSNELRASTSSARARAPLPEAGSGEGESASARRRETSTTARQNHRSFTINGPGPETLTLTGGSNYPGRSFSSEDLSTLATLGTVDDVFSAAKVHSHTDLRAAIGNMRRDSEGRGVPLLASETRPPVTLAEDPTPKLPRAPGPPRSPVQSFSFPPAESNPSPRTRVTAPRRPPPLTTMPSAAGTGTSSSESLPPRPATARVRITQETVTTETYLSEPMPAAAAASAAAVAANPQASGGTMTGQFCLSPTSDEVGAPFESSFGESSFSKPLVDALQSRSSSQGHGWAPGWTGFGSSSAAADSATPSKRGLTTSPSLANITVTAGVSVGSSASASVVGPPPVDLATRRASSAGLASALSRIGAGGGTAAGRDAARASFSGSSSSSSRSRDRRAGKGDGSGSSSGNGRSGGFFGRALGRKGSRAV
ncbi:hypothetical protein JCM10908_000155 [Rhodotorula pacifica]|uniref:uncharacterized protein n=1 Tax=Rhodotorula pacifica TaxID=1495444 RepID=UPI003172101A